MNINEIAKLAGVSRATVSRYLNKGYVSEDKKEKIAKIIKETGYQPSSTAQTLRSKKTKLIGVIIPKINSDSISRMVAGINLSLQKEGYQMLLACTNNQENEEIHFLNTFKEKNVDGIILLGTIFTAEHKAIMKQYQVPLVVLGQHTAGFPCVYSDDYGATKALAKAILPAARKIGYIGVTEKDEAVGHKRGTGFIDALHDANFDEANVTRVESSFSMDSGYESAKELLEHHPDIDTVLCATDTIAIGAMKYIKETSHRIPEDIQIAGLGDSTLSKVAVPSLTTVHFFYKTAGIEAARNLLEMIADSSVNVRKELKLGFEILPGQSTRS